MKIKNIEDIKSYSMDIKKSIELSKEKQDIYNTIFTALGLISLIIAVICFVMICFHLLITSTSTIYYYGKPTLQIIIK